MTLGHGLGLPILGEGVETEEQLAFLRRESCDQVQGFLIRRIPHPIALGAITGADPRLGCSEACAKCEAGIRREPTIGAPAQDRETA